MKAFITSFLFLILAITTYSNAQTAVVDVSNFSAENMHVVFVIAEPGNCTSSNPNNGDNGGFIQSPGQQSYTVPVASGTERIVWASCSPRPACCKHRSAIDNQVPLCFTNPWDQSRTGYHYSCTTNNPPYPYGFCEPKQTNFSIAITGQYSIEIH